MMITFPPCADCSQANSIPLNWLHGALLLYLLRTYLKVKEQKIKGCTIFFTHLQLLILSEYFFEQILQLPAIATLVLNM